MKTSKRKQLPVQDRPARKLTGKRAELAYRPRDVIMPVTWSMTEAQKEAYRAGVTRSCATAGHPLTFETVGSEPKKRVCACGQISCDA